VSVEPRLNLYNELWRCAAPAAVGPASSSSPTGEAASATRWTRSSARHDRLGRAIERTVCFYRVRMNSYSQVSDRSCSRWSTSAAARSAPLHRRQGRAHSGGREIGYDPRATASASGLEGRVVGLARDFGQRDEYDV
jgi:hypothetical protein